MCLPGIAGPEWECRGNHGLWWGNLQDPPVYPESNMDPGELASSPAKKKGPAKLAIRPEHISFHNAQKKDGFSGSILSATYVGAKTEYQVETKAGKLFVMVASTERLRDVNTKINLGLSPDKMLLFND